MRIKILAVGQKPPNWVRLATDEYLGRFPADTNIQLLEVKPAIRSSSGSPQQWMQQEARLIEQLSPERHHLVILDERGEDLTTRQLAQRLERWRTTGLPITIVIGGADGIAPELKSKADETVRLSSLTLPHAMVRVLLLEQLFRAWSILNNHPYHRD